MPELSPHIGLALVVAREIRRLSQSELAEQTGIRPNQVSRYETGAVIPQLVQLERLLEGLGISYVEFFYIVAVIERTVRVVEACDRRDSPEALAVHGALLHLTESAEARLRVAEEIERVFEHEDDRATHGKST